MADYWIAVFQRPGDAALALRDLQQLKVALMPTPRGISASCGLTLRFPPELADAVCPALLALFPEPGRCRFYEARKTGKQHSYSPVISNHCP